MIPKPPVFPDSQKHVDKKVLAKEIRRILVGLSEQMVGPENRNLIMRFASCIHPDSCNDPARLPYISEKADRKDHMLCLCASIYSMLCAYWQFCEGATTADVVESKIQDIREIIRRGLKTYEIKGDKKDGFYLA